MTTCMVTCSTATSVASFEPDVIVIPVGRDAVAAEGLASDHPVFLVMRDEAAIADFVCSRSFSRVVIDRRAFSDPVPLIILLRETLPSECAIFVFVTGEDLSQDLRSLLEDGEQALVRPVRRSTLSAGTTARALDLNCGLRGIEQLKAERDGLALRVEALENALRGVQGVGAVVRVAARTSTPRVAHHLTRVYRLGLRVTGRR